jgi:uncharacterized membrane protein
MGISPRFISAEKPAGAFPAHDLKSCAGVLVVIFFFCVSACTRQPHYSEPVLKGPVVVVNIAGLREGVPQFHSYNSQGHAVSFFIIKVDGKVLSFIDACMKCHPRRRGFRFDNGSVICRACDERFPVSEIAKGFGSCYPIKLEGQVHGEEYHIPATALEEMARRYFS